jgi:hypothetical protein
VNASAYSDPERQYTGVNVSADFSNLHELFSFYGSQHTMQQMLIFGITVRQSISGTDRERGSAACGQL